MINLEYHMVKGFSPLVNTNMSMDEFFTTIFIMSFSIYAFMKFIKNEQNKDSNIYRFIDRLF